MECQPLDRSDEQILKGLVLSLDRPWPETTWKEWMSTTGEFGCKGILNDGSICGAAWVRRRGSRIDGGEFLRPESGSVRMRLSPNAREAYWIVGADFVGHGRGTALVAALRSMVYEAKPKVQTVIADIDPTNTHSIHIAEKCGFRRQDQSRHWVLRRKTGPRRDA